MEFKGTKGKWEFDIDEYHQYAVIHSANSGNGVICEVDYTKSNMSQVPYDFNLMAHAPELLDALYEIVCAFENNALTDVSFAKELIKSATEVDNGN